MCQLLHRSGHYGVSMALRYLKTAMSVFRHLKMAMNLKMARMQFLC